MKNGPRLSLVHDATRVTIAGVPFVLGQERPPFAVDARVLEDDRYHVLAADKGFRDPGEPALKVRTRALEAEPTEPGTLVLGPLRPPTLLAVVHDLDGTPTCRGVWVRAAYAAITEHIEARHLRALSLPLLGTRFASLPDALAARLFVEAFTERRLASLERVFIPVAGGDLPRLHEALKRALEAVAADRG